MMNKSLNYAYPQKFADGGEVQVTDLSGLKQEPLGNDMVLVKFQDGSYGKTQKALFQAAESLGAPMGSQKDFANWHLNEWAPKVVSDPAFKAAHDKFNTDQISYNQAVMDSDPQYAQNRLAFVQTNAPNNAAAISAAEELVATGNYAEKPSEQKSTSYSFVDADGNSYSMGDARPGHSGTSLERAIANVQEYYDFAPGSFTVSVPSEKRLVGTYDSGSGSFQAAENPTYTDQVPGYTEGGVEFQGPDMPPPDMATTLAMGEEDGGGGVIEPDLPRPPNPFLGLEPDTFTTMAKGEEDGGLLPIPENPIGDLTTMAMGEEDGGGGFLLPPPSQIDPPMFQPVTPPPNTGYTPPPVVVPEFDPLQVAPGLPQGDFRGRTYGAYSQAGQLGGTTLRPFTPYMPPQQNEGIRSLIDEPVSYLTESGPRSSVFRRS